MNILDGVIMAVITALVMTGFFSGIGRVAAGFVAIYFATIVAALSYESLGSGLRGLIANFSPASSELTGFIIVLLIFSIIFYVAVTASFSKVEDKRGRFAILDNVGGAALAIIVGILTIAMTLSVAVILLGAVNRSSSAGGGKQLGALDRQIQESSLVPVFTAVQPGITLAYRPWFPGGLPEILVPPPD